MVNAGTRRRASTVSRESIEMRYVKPTADGSGLLHATIAAVLAIAAAIVFVATLPGCAAPPKAVELPPRPVPSLVGHERGEAEAALARAGLHATYVFRHAELSTEMVVDQTPEAGTPVTPSTPIEVVIASSEKH
jgi:beta-lactam-binding protein with PASTA domain